MPTTWTCNPLFYGSKDGCDCECGAWDPDCETTTYSQKVFNCDTSNNEVQCVMSRTTPSTPVCLYDRMASLAAIDAGYPSLNSSNPTLSTSTIIAVSVGTTLGIVVLVSVITFFILRYRKRQQRRQSVQLIELMQSTESTNF